MSNTTELTIKEPGRREIELTFHNGTLMDTSRFSTNRTVSSAAYDLDADELYYLVAVHMSDTFKAAMGIRDYDYVLSILKDAREFFTDEYGEVDVVGFNEMFGISLKFFS